MTSTVDLKPFYPEYIEIEEIEDFDNENIHIHMKSLRLTSRCPECGEVSGRVHSLAARRNIRDLPILDKGVLITIKSRKFFCENEGCRTRVFTESMDKFIGIRWKWTHRCEEFIVAVAMNTSCEAASKICGLINIPVSGDTVIRMLLRQVVCADYLGESIGVDDWATKKGHNYSTMICDLESGRPIALLPGRDGSSLRKWLEHNKQVKVVTRDRANAYASAISAVLPEAVQIADRFHLHHNLLNSVKDAIKGIIPEKVWVVEKEGDLDSIEEKKTF